VGNDERSNRRVGQVGGHRQLDDGKKFADPYADAVKPRIRSSLDSEMRTLMNHASRRGEGTQIGEHGDFGEAVGDSLLFRLVLRQADLS